MNCGCREMYDKIITLIRSKEKSFNQAYGEGSSEVRELKGTVLSEIYTLLPNNSITCNCYTGQLLQRMQEILRNFYDRREQIRREYSQTAYDFEIEKVFDKVNLILYNINK